VLTAVLLAVTGTLSLAGLLSPAVLAALERTPAALHGEAWRWVSTLTVQDGGVLGTASNLIFLALLGAAAEQVVGRVPLALCYLAAGLTGQVAGVFWQPVGAGNSVAICGLAGVLAWSLRTERTPSWAGRAVALWLGALLATWWPPLFAVGVLGAVTDRAVARSRPRAQVAVAVGASGVVAAVLVAVGNIHGPALAVGTLAGAVVARLQDPREASGT
jgi:membrane associated rhomboid family serine protease